MTATPKEAILSSEIIKKIKNEPEKFWQLLSTETPVEWTLDGVSEQTGEPYKYLSIDTLELLMELIFGGFEDTIIYQNVNLQGNTGIVSISVQIEFTETKAYKDDYPSEKILISHIKHKKSGTASITVMDNFYFKDGTMKFYERGAKKPLKAAQLLRTAVPLCLTEARKNAIKNICNLFGRNLNREEILPVIQVGGEHEKVPADIIIMRKYENAVKKKDEKIIQEILDNYIISYEQQAGIK